MALWLNPALYGIVPQLPSLQASALRCQILRCVFVGTPKKSKRLFAGIIIHKAGLMIYQSLSDVDLRADQVTDMKTQVIVPCDCLKGNEIFTLLLFGSPA